MLTTIQAFSQDFKKKFGVTLSLSDLVDKWMLVSHQGNITNCWGGEGGDTLQWTRGTCSKLKPCFYQLDFVLHQKFIVVWILLKILHLLTH